MLLKIILLAIIGIGMIANIVLAILDIKNFNKCLDEIYLIESEVEGE